MPMKKNFLGNWEPLNSGWGLIDVETGNAVEPIALITDEKIVMTDWEVQDIAVQVVKSDLDKRGYQLMSW